MVEARFHFHGELNDFLARPQRGRTFACQFAPTSSAKHVIEALGVPHTEVGAILRNGGPVGFDAQIEPDDLIEIHPARRAATDMASGGLLLRPPLRAADLRFIADAHLGGLAQLLRLAGFDTRYDNNFPDEEIERLAQAESRIVLTRDRELLKRRTVLYGCYVRALQADDQWHELADRLALAPHARPFRLCLMCNAPLRPAGPGEIDGRVPDGVRERHTRFVTCDVCRRVFWEGSHWRRMRARIDALADADR
ncbi:Mut7-C RNAse domain-containing protein [Caballeronia sp. LZ032]|uniref:Mut7-C RNAse domain-containing protein n=1 Tax=Caballeronia sp. LZ032 TaxID=3038565 RepID=UPI002858D88D|nr:Mut7-C RNAse domain-containing protein [Caballeronia sp. LZ032]MDR5879369.1 Mut7-C RNAse domain-containing protein [Caballeronia sp. LZ032]